MGQSSIPDEGLVEKARKDPDYIRLQEEHPIRAKLILSSLERFEAAKELFELELSKSATVETFQKFLYLAKQQADLATWISTPQEIPVEEIYRSAEQMIRAGLPFREALTYVKLCQRKTGRPTTRRRQLAVDAFERRLKAAPPSWRTLARELDYCKEDKQENKEDDEQVDSSSFICSERLRKQVKVLERLLKKYKIEY